MSVSHGRRTAVMENNAFTTVAHPVGSLSLCCRVSKVLPFYSLFRNMKVHIVTRSEALGETG